MEKDSERGGSRKVKEWIEATTRLLVDNPDKVRVEEVMSPDESTSYFSIYCQISDKGQVVGRSGVNVDSIRTLAHAMGLAQYKRRIEITVDNSDRNRSGRAR